MANLMFELFRRLLTLGDNDHPIAIDNAEARLTADSTGRARVSTGFFDDSTVRDKFAAGSFAAHSTTRALFAAGIWQVGHLADGILSADAAGRAKLADGILNAATVVAKFAAGCFAADAPTRALFANGLFTGKHIATGALFACTGTGIDATGGAGNVTLTAAGPTGSPNAANGDRLVAVINLTDAPNTVHATSFAVAANGSGTISQTGANLATKNLLFIFQSNQ